MRRQFERTAPASRQGGPLMLTAEDDAPLCRVERNVPLGWSMHRHWLPILGSDELCPIGQAAE